MDYYKDLEIPHDASESDIRKAYFKLALKYHPDKNQAPGAKEKFEKISRAYEILSDPEKRRVYDAQPTEEPSIHATTVPSAFATNNYPPRSAFRNDPFAGFHFHSPDEIFAQFFRGQDPFSIFNGSALFSPGSTFENDPFFSFGSEGAFAVHMPPAVRAGYRNVATSNNGNRSSSSTRVTRSRFVNSNQETVTIEKIEDDKGTRVIEDYGQGRRRVIVNGVEQENTLPKRQRENSYLEGFGSGFQSSTRHNGSEQQQHPFSRPHPTVLDEIRQNNLQRDSHHSNNIEQDTSSSSSRSNIHSSNNSSTVSNNGRFRIGSNHGRDANYAYIPGPQSPPEVGFLQKLKQIVCWCF